MKLDNVELINFIDLSYENKIMILNWRNHENVRKWMYDSIPITEEIHLSFINQLQNNIKNQYFLVKINNIDIGTIYFTNINTDKKECEFGLYANPFKKIMGIGKVLEDTCIKYAFDVLKLKKLKLEVFSDNQKALNLYKKFNFKEIDKKIVNNESVICMELKNEEKFLS
jgi:UDP-4-amino-4,6-dideoxy-N-acetyl-beta-L-altrosamine N-acetyltransferase